MSRVAGGEMLFGDIEKEAFRKIMRRLERFSGVEVLTYVVMGNHFHLLLRVPERTQILRKFENGTRAEREVRLLDHLKALYSRAYLKQLKDELATMREQGMDQLYEETIRGFLARMGSLKPFMKEHKEHFSCWSKQPFASFAAKIVPSLPRPPSGSFRHEVDCNHSSS